MNLPPLPISMMPDGLTHLSTWWSEEQIRSYGRACARAALEEAIRVFDDMPAAYHLDTIRVLAEEIKT